LLRGYLRKRTDGENLRAYFRRQTDAELREDLAGGEFAAVERDPSPGRVPATVG
jgi:sulfite reductase (ferredoxin)